MNPNKNIKRQIESNSFNLSFHPVFSHNPIRLMNIGFNKSLELLKKRVGNNVSIPYLLQTYQTYFYKIEVLESAIKSELEQIAEDVIREMYDIPEQIIIQPKIFEQDEIDYDFNSQEENKELINEIPPDRLQVIQEEVKKRIILNLLVNGSSVMIWSSAYYIAKNRLDKLNKKLVDFYNVYSAVVGFLLWMQEPDVNMDLVEKQGVCEVDFDSGLKCEGVNFPVLLLETNKVVLDYLICKGIPSDFSEEELKLYYALSDDFNQEIWHNILSPVIYADFLEVVDTESQNLPKIISKLSTVDYESLKDLFISVQENKEEAKKKLKNILYES